MMATSASTAKRKRPWRSLPCPGCGAKKTNREISYGYPAGPWDDGKFANGGCCPIIGGDEITCRECGWSGFKEDLRILASPPVVLTSRFLEAMNYANAQHAGQIRKGTNIAYISHPFGVAGLIIEAGGDEDQAIGGLLHDVAEDCGGEPRLRDIKKKFGARVETIVRGCSDSLGAKGQKKAPWRERKEEHLERLHGANGDILLVTAADKTHNARATVTDLDMLGPVLWERFDATPEDIVWYYESVCAVLKTREVTSILLSPLTMAIDAMRRYL